MIEAWSADGKQVVRLAQVSPAALSTGEPSGAPARKIQVLAADLWGMSLNHLLSERQSKPYVEARWAAMLLIHRTLPYSINRIGHIFKKDHTTVMHGLRRAKAMLAEGVEPFTSLFKQLESACPSPMDGQAEGQRQASQGRALAQEFEGVQK